MVDILYFILLILFLEIAWLGLRSMLVILAGNAEAGVVKR